jgi:hypothetical protein
MLSGAGFERTTTNHPEIAITCHDRRPIERCFAVIVDIAIRDPFADIAEHSCHAIRIGGET